MLQIDNSSLIRFQLKLESYLKSKRVSFVLDRYSEYITHRLWSYIEKRFVDKNDLPTAPIIYSVKDIKFPKNFPKKLRVGKIRSRTGNLKSSFRIERLTKYRYLLYSTSEYVLSQELGAIITPKRRRFLTIPLDKESWGKPALEFEDTLVYKRFVLKRLGGGRYKPIYWLVKSVELKPAKFVSLGFKDYIKSEEFRKTRNEMLDKIIERLV